MKNYIVHYRCAANRYTNYDVNLMFVRVEDSNGEELYLYADYDLSEEPVNKSGELIDEDAGYNELVQEIIEQAKAYGISSAALVFPYGELING